MHMSPSGILQVNTSIHHLSMFTPWCLAAIYDTLDFSLTDRSTSLESKTGHSISGIWEVFL